MRANKVIIPIILIFGTLGSALLPDLIQTTSPSTPDKPSYAFSLTNTSLDLNVASSIDNYLFIKINLDGKIITNTTSSLKTNHIFHFYYYDSNYSISAGLFTKTDRSDLKYFINNTPVYQPLPFIVTHQVKQFLNTTEITLESTTKLNISTSTVDSISNLVPDGTESSFYKYNFATSLNSSSLHLVDIYQRSLTKLLTFPTLSDQSNDTSTTLDFTFTKLLVNMTTLTIDLNTTELSSARVTINNTSDIITMNSTSISTFHSFTFTNLNFTTYQILMTVLTANKLLSKYSSITINDTSYPIITKYIISTGLTSINATFSFSKPSKADFYLMYPNGTISTRVGQNYVLQNNQFYNVPIGNYNITVGLTDQLNHHKQYNFPFIATDRLNNNSNIYFTTNQSVLTDQSKALELYPAVYFNGSKVMLIDSLVISLEVNNLVIQTSTVSLANTLVLLLDQTALKMVGTTVLTVQISLPLYHLSAKQNLQYVFRTNQFLNASNLTLQSYVSNVTSNEVITLHISGTGYYNTSNAYIDLFSPSLGYSLAFVPLTINGGQLEQEFFITIPATTTMYINLQAVVIFGTTYYPCVSSIRLEVTTGFDTSVPQAITNLTLSNNSLLVNLSFNTSEPVLVELYFGLNSTSFASLQINSLYQSVFLINLSQFLHENTNNYYYIKLTDSNGHSKSYNNNSFYYQVFMPKLDYQNPYNTTIFSVNAGGVISFQSNEDVTVSVTCMDKNGIFGSYTCGSVSYNRSFAIQLQFPLTGVLYIIQKVVLTDRAGNVATIIINMEYTNN